jgi:hypothetical protein
MDGNSGRASERCFTDRILHKEAIMRRHVLFLVSAFLIALPAYSSAEKGSPAEFRNYMHQIYKSYRNALLSATTYSYDTTEIHLKHLQEYIREVPRHIPEDTEKGVKLNKASFLKRLDDFDKKIANLRKTIHKVDVSAVGQLRNDIFSICVDCHKESKLPYLFRFTEHKTVFEEYMHGTWDNFRMAGVYLKNGQAGKAEESLKIVSHYLTLLQDTYPETGPSGVVMDRKWLNESIKTTKRVCEIVETDLREKKSADLTPLKKELNVICVACHEPERIE